MRFAIGSALVIGALAVGTVYAAEGDDSAVAAPASWGNFNIPPERMSYFREVVETVREKYPDEFNEAMALRQSNPGEAIRRGVELARRAGFDVPAGFGQTGSAQTEAGQGQSFSLVGKTGTVSRDFRRKKMRAVNQALEERFPEEYARLEEMRSSDPEEARYYFRELVSRLDDLPEIYASLEPAPSAAEEGEMSGSGRRRFGAPPSGDFDLFLGGAGSFPDGRGAFAPGGGGEAGGSGSEAAPADGGEKAAPESSSLPWWME